MNRFVAPDAGNPTHFQESRFLDCVGPLLVLQSKDSDIVEIVTGSEIVVSNPHGDVRILFRVIRRVTKRILKAVHA
jgi:hypothetical protein